MEKWVVGFKDGSGKASEDEGAYILVRNIAWRKGDAERVAIVVRGGRDEWGVPQGVIRAKDADAIVEAHNGQGNLIETLTDIWRIAAGERDFASFQDKIRIMAADAINKANGVGGAS